MPTERERGRAGERLADMINELDDATRELDRSEPVYQAARRRHEDATDELRDFLHEGTT